MLVLFLKFNQGFFLFFYKPFPEVHTSFIIHYEEKPEFAKYFNYYNSK